jgi:hypothetical protein
VSTAEEDQNPETQSRPPREHLAAPPDVADAGAFGDPAGADQLRGRKEWRQLLDLARARQVDPVVVTLAWPQLEQRQHPQAGPRERVKAGMDRGRAAGP